MGRPNWELCLALSTLHSEVQRQSRSYCPRTNLSYYTCKLLQKCLQDVNFWSINRVNCCKIFYIIINQAIGRNPFCNTTTIPLFQSDCTTKTQSLLEIENFSYAYLYLTPHEADMSKFRHDMCYEKWLVRLKAIKQFDGVWRFRHNARVCRWDRWTVFPRFAIASRGKSGL